MTCVHDDDDTAQCAPRAEIRVDQRPPMPAHLARHSRESITRQVHQAMPRLELEEIDEPSRPWGLAGSRETLAAGDRIQGARLPGVRAAGDRDFGARIRWELPRSICAQQEFYVWIRRHSRSRQVAGARA